MDNATKPSELALRIQKAFTKSVQEAVAEHVKAGRMMKFDVAVFEEEPGIWLAQTLNICSACGQGDTKRQALMNLDASLRLEQQWALKERRTPFSSMETSEKFVTWWNSEKQQEHRKDCSCCETTVLYISLPFLPYI